MQELDLKTVPLTGHNLIEASAGTGKTFAIAALYLRLILEKQLGVDQILVVTFTVAATEELKNRIRNRLRQALEGFSNKLKQEPDPFLAWILENFEAQKARPILQNAVRNFDRCAIFTIHGFCQRMLVENAFAGSSLFETELLSDQTHFLQETLNDFWRQNILQTSLLFISYLKEKKTSPAQLKDLAQKSLNHTLIAIKPDSPCPEDSKQENHFLNLREKARLVLESKKQDIQNLLLSKALNKKIYQEKKIPDWLQSMQGFLESEIPNPVLFDKFVNFTSQKLKNSTKKGHTQPEHTFFDLCQELELAAQELDQVYAKRLDWLKAQCLKYMRQELPKRKEKKGLLSFDDLLVNMHSALNSASASAMSGAIARQYRAALIDEFQDTDPLQYNIFSRLFSFEQQPLFLIGDPKQAIYSFRGADIFAYLQACNQVDQAYTMQVNWRSDPDFIQAVNTLFTASNKPFVFDFIDYSPVKPAPVEQEALYIEDDPAHLKIWFLENSDQDAQAKEISKENAEACISRAVASEISRLLYMSAQKKAFFQSTKSKRPVSCGDIAVLVRSHAQALLIQDHLHELQIPCVLSQSGNIMDSPEARAMQRILAAVSNFTHWETLRAALVSELIGFNAAELEDLQNNQAEWDLWLEKFANYQDLWNQKGFIFFFESFLQQENVRSRLLNLVNGERKLTNILHLMEILHQQEKDEHAGQSALLSWLEQNLDPGTTRVDEYELRLESDAQAVQVVTIHKSKGLEYPIVFSPFLHRGSQVKPPVVFHDQENNNALTFYPGSRNIAPWTLQAEKEELAENMRLFYVALTRAKNRCYLAWGRIKLAQTSAWAHLLYQNNFNDLPGKLDELKANVDKLDADEFKKPLKSLSLRCPAIQVTAPPDTSYAYNPYTQEQNRLAPMSFKRTLQKNWRLSSFSFLIKSQSFWEQKAQDEFQFNFNPVALEDNKKPDIHSFPKGAKSGTLLHAILEEIDFQDSLPEQTKELISNKLEASDYSLDWVPVLQNMVESLVHVPLLKTRSWTLSEISPKQRLNELEFYLPLKVLSVDSLSSLYKRFSGTLFSEHIFNHLQKLGFYSHQGFLRGFIDLVFEKNNKFYLLDWKSNYLGPGLENYHKELISEPMLNEFYFLQYHLYTLALDAYLKSRMPGYNYAEHFGGIFYIFLRGIDAQAGPDYGIFYDLPDPEFIKQLSLTLRPEEQKAHAV